MVIKKKKHRKADFNLNSSLEGVIGQREKAEQNSHDATFNDTGHPLTTQ